MLLLQQFTLHLMVFLAYRYCAGAVVDTTHKSHDHTVPQTHWAEKRAPGGDKELKDSILAEESAKES